MNEDKWLADQFAAHRTHLRRMAYRMLGSLSDADDAIQEAWLRLSRSDRHGVENVAGWLTTVVGRVCLDMLRSRAARREEPLGPHVPEPMDDSNAEQEMLLADSVGIALLVVLEMLAPAERVAFVLHDMFAVPFDEIAPIVRRSPAAARQLASRARRQVQGAAKTRDVELRHQREVVDAFLAAARAGDFEALLAVLDPDVAFRADSAAAKLGGSAQARGPQAVARFFRGRAGGRGVQPALVDGAVGLVVAPAGRLRLVLRIAVVEGKITDIEAIADPERLRKLNLAILDR